MISLAFVFVALTEFAFLLFIKQWHCSKYETISTDTSCRNWEEGVESKVDGFENFQDNALRKSSNANIISRRKRVAQSIHQNERNKQFNGLSIYTQIDLCVFVVFNFSFLIFNGIYWMY